MNRDWRKVWIWWGALFLGSFLVIEGLSLIYGTTLTWTVIKNVDWKITIAFISALFIWLLSHFARRYKKWNERFK